MRGEANLRCNGFTRGYERSKVVGGATGGKKDEKGKGFKVDIGRGVPGMTEKVPTPPTPWQIVCPS